jgi:hypothetical protein
MVLTQGHSDEAVVVRLYSPAVLVLKRSFRTQLAEIRECVRLSRSSVLDCRSRVLDCQVLLQALRAAQVTAIREAGAGNCL